MKKIIYIGNNLARGDKYMPTLVTLSNLLQSEGYILKIASDKQNKMFRILDMIWTVIVNYKSGDVVLIDTFGTFNFYYALVTSQVCRLLNIPYIPILHGGNLPNRFHSNPKDVKRIFSHSYKNIVPSNFLKVELEKVGYQGFLIPNTIEIENYKFKLRDTYTPKILYVRAFHQIYNPTMAVKVSLSLNL